MEKREKFRIMNSWLWSKYWIILVIWKNRCLGRRAYAKSPPTPLSRIHSLRGASPLEKILIFDVIFLDCLFKVTFGSSLELCTNENRALRFLIGNTHIDIYIYLWALFGILVFQFIELQRWLWVVSLRKLCFHRLRGSFMVLYSSELLGSFNWVSLWSVYNLFRDLVRWCI